jgi:hypothetical protein
MCANGLQTEEVDMRGTRLKSWAGLLVCVVVAFTAQAAKVDTISTLAEMNTSGPRIGIGAIVDKGDMYNYLQQHGGDRTISQFGWHFEFKTAPLGGGPSLILEIVPLIAGLEYGMVIPSLTLPVGIRMPFGTEFGMGPNFSFGGTKDIFRTAIVFALGHSFDYKGIGIPLNLAYTKGPSGQQVTFLVGYAIVKNVRKNVQTMEQ